MRVLNFSLIISLCAVCAMVPTTLEGESTPQEGLFLGPVVGLTTTWHPAPKRTSIPLGARLQFRVDVPPGTIVTWNGAEEAAKSSDQSIATCHLDKPGRQVVTVSLRRPDGRESRHHCILDVEPVQIEDIKVKRVQVLVDPVNLDPESPNASSYQYFRSGSVAELTQLDTNRYRTSVGRKVQLRMEVDPFGFAPLIEWRYPGDDLQGHAELGERVEIRYQHPMVAPVWVGPTAGAEKVYLETYRVQITSHESQISIVPEGQKVTFTATTVPAGFEDEITWLASTSYGSATPWMGKGGEFTVVFHDTFGPQQWLGVRADNAEFYQDQKPRLTISGPEGLILGALGQLNAERNSTVVDPSQVLWTSLAPQILTVSSDGVVTPHSVGIGTVRGQFQSASDAHEIEVFQGDEPFLLFLKSGQGIPDEGVSQETLDALAAHGTPQVHVLLQVFGTLNESQQAQLRSLGVRLLNVVPDRGYFASVPLEEVEDVAALSTIRSILPIRPAVKLEGSTFLDRSNTLTLSVVFHDDVEEQEARELVAAQGGTILEEGLSFGLLTITLPGESLESLLAADLVRWVEPMAERITTNDLNRQVTGVEDVQGVFQLDGNGVFIAQWDNGHAGNHQDLQGRITPGDAAGVTTHATHVAGTMLGDGLLSGGTLRGMAPAANLIAFEWGSFVSDYTTALGLGADLSNNSWGFLSSPGVYSGNSEKVDGLVRGSAGRKLPIVWSAGNKNAGCDSPTPGYDCLLTPGTAKNTITVAATNAEDDSLAGFSSRGPTDDGRIKPDVAAPGCRVVGGVTSTLPGDAYGSSCGTSMAAPTVTGSLALLLQQWRGLSPMDPWPSTLKAVLVHTAEDLLTPGPDYDSGYGRIDIFRAAELIEANDGVQELIKEGVLNHGETRSFAFNLPEGTLELKISLAWDDPAAPANNLMALVHDLDLTLFDPDGVICPDCRPFVLDPTNPTAAAGRGADHRNNVEQIQVLDPAPGVWRLELTGISVPQGAQEYSLILPTGNQPEWSDRQLMPVGRIRHVAASGTDVNGVERIFVLSGGSENQAFSRTDGYDPATDTWASFAPIPTPRVEATETVGQDGRIYVIGGLNGCCTIYDVMEAYDPGSDTWDTQLAPMNVARAEAATATGADGKIYVFGGRDQVGGTTFDSVEEYDPATDTWTLKKPMPVPRRRIGAELAADGLIYVFGANDTGEISRVDAYDPVQDQWFEKTPLPEDSSGRGVTLGANGRVYVINGGEYSTGSDPRVWSYSPASDTWREEPDSIRGYRFLAAAAFGDRVYAIGGAVRFSPETRRIEALGPIP